MTREKQYTTRIIYDFRQTTQNSDDSAKLEKILVSQYASDELKADGEKGNKDNPGKTVPAPLKQTGEIHDSSDDSR